ncbi:hypothetical protein RJT34_24908 [Clitoria ternatea]|uniref:Uncharacterized protein n=1 Tax=Clitoria ternatea TaxID=43366 RepID=A0AAN9IIF2_CLITE
MEERELSTARRRQARADRGRTAGSYKRPGSAGVGVSSGSLASGARGRRKAGSSSREANFIAGKADLGGDDIMDGWVWSSGGIRVVQMSETQDRGQDGVEASRVTRKAGFGLGVHGRCQSRRAKRFTAQRWSRTRRSDAERGCQRGGRSAYRTRSSAGSRSV